MPILTMKKLLLIFSTSIIVSCGGGGGGGESPSVSTPPPPPPPSPTITFEASNETIANRGGKSTLSWSSTNTNECIASGDWDGNKELNGEELISLNISGEYIYDLSCSGDGGTVSSSVQVNSTNCSSLQPLKKPQLTVDGRGAACLLENDGMACFGNKYSWVYTEDSDSNFSLKEIPDLQNPRMISSSDNQVCALDDNGITCWGEPIADAFDLSEVPNLSCPTFIDISYDTACSIDDNGITCWGDLGEEGNDTDYISDAVNSFSLRNPYILELSSRFICVVDDDGIQCGGGDNYEKQEGNGTDILIAAIPNDRVTNITDISGTDNSGVMFSVIGTAINDDDLFKQETRTFGGSGGPRSHHVSDVPDGRNNQIVVSWGFTRGCSNTGCVNHVGRYRTNEGEPRSNVMNVLNPVSGGISTGTAVCIISKEHCNNYDTRFLNSATSYYACDSHQERRTRFFPGIGNVESSSVTSDQNSLSCQYIGATNASGEGEGGLSFWGEGSTSGIPRITNGGISKIGYRKSVGIRCKYGIDLDEADYRPGSECIGFQQYGNGAREFYHTGELEEVQGMLSMVQKPIVVSTAGKVTCVLQSKVKFVDTTLEDGDGYAEIVEPQIPAIECWGDIINTQYPIYTWHIPIWDNGKWKDRLTGQYLN